MKKQTLIILVLGIIIAGSIGYFIGHKKTVTEPTTASKPITTNTKTASSAIAKQSISNLSSSASSKTSDLVYTTKIGIKIPYPKDYSFQVHPQHDPDIIKTPECSDGATKIDDDLYISRHGSGQNAIQCALKTNRGSEYIVFGFEKNNETVRISTSDTSFYQQNVCEVRSRNVSNEVLKISGQNVYHITTTGGLETYCVSNPNYTFVLDRNQSNKVKIDVSKITFPN